VSPRGLAKPDLEQTPAKTVVAAWRTYSSAEPTYSAVSQLAPHSSEGREDTASSSQVETAGRLKLLL
jgi:hypothetical protein